MAKVSVIVPVYNSADSIEACVASITAQDLRDIEILLIDDGSADESGEICDRLASSDSRIRVFHLENGGPARARNVGIDNATGDYLAFCDSDDYLSTGALSYMYTKIAHYDVLCCGLIFDYEGENRRNVYTSQLTLNAKTLRELKDRNLLDTMCNKLYRTAYIKENGLRLPDNELYEDTAFNQQLLMLMPKITFSRKCLYHYMQKQGESITRRYNPTKLTLMKARCRDLLALEKKLGGDGSTFGMFYLRSLLSCFTDFYVPGCPLTFKEKENIIRQERKSAAWQDALRLATAYTKADKLLLFTAKRGPWFIKKFCKLFYVLKYKLRKLFFALR